MSYFSAVEIEINRDCNRACSYCPNRNYERKTADRMEESLFLLLMEQLKMIGFRGRISYHFYNEPLLSPDLEKFVGLTRSHLPDSNIEVFSNGLLLTRERMQSLIQQGVDRFVLTRHEGVKSLPIESADLNQDGLLRNRIDLIKFSDLTFSGRGGLLPGIGNCKISPPLPLPCLIPSSLIVVTTSGNVLPCFEDYLEQNVMGNIRTMTIQEIWHSEKYTKFRENLRQKKRGMHPVCRDCNNILVTPRASSGWGPCQECNGLSCALANS